MQAETSASYSNFLAVTVSIPKLYVFLIELQDFQGPAVPLALCIAYSSLEDSAQDIAA
jgi:hypothetical protein